MTLDEKIMPIHGGPEAQPSGIGGAGTARLPRFGIPSLRQSTARRVSNNVWSVA
jgi:hypothetical protein